MAADRMNGRMKRVLITGAAGMVGATLVRRLASLGVLVHVMVRANSNLFRLRSILHRVCLHTADLTNSAQVRKIVIDSSPDTVYHLASTPFNPPVTVADEHFRVNVLGTLALLEALAPTSEARLVYTGSGAVYGSQTCSRETDPFRPGTLLGASKAGASILLETYRQMHRMAAIELRLFTPYGPWEVANRLIPQAINAALNGIDFPTTYGNQTRDFVYIDDVIDALVAVGDSESILASVYNIGSGTATPIRNVIDQIFLLAKTKASPIFGAIPTRPDEIMEMSAEIGQARSLLNWYPRISLQEGLQRTIAWTKEHAFNLGNAVMGARADAA